LPTPRYSKAKRLDRETDFTKALGIGERCISGSTKPISEVQALIWRKWLWRILKRH